MFCTTTSSASSLLSAPASSPAPSAPRRAAPSAVVLRRRVANGAVVFASSALVLLSGGAPAWASEPVSTSVAASLSGQDVCGSDAADGTAEQAIWSERVVWLGPGLFGPVFLDPSLAPPKGAAPAPGARERVLWTEGAATAAAAKPSQPRPNTRALWTE